MHKRKMKVDPIDSKMLLVVSQEFVLQTHVPLSMSLSGWHFEAIQKTIGIIKAKLKKELRETHKGSLKFNYKTVLLYLCIFFPARKFQADT